MIFDEVGILLVKDAKYATILLNSCIGMDK